jgi:ATP-dependent RNA helicase RhlE
MIGDAISFVTPDDGAALRALERFITRGIPRKKLEGFDYRDAGEPERPQQLREGPAKSAKPAIDARSRFTPVRHAHAPRRRRPRRSW